LGKGEIGKLFHSQKHFWKQVGNLKQGGNASLPQGGWTPLLEHPQKRSHENQLIHRRLTKTKSVSSGQDPERVTQGDSQTDMGPYAHDTLNPDYLLVSV